MLGVATVREVLFRMRGASRTAMRIAKKEISMRAAQIALYLTITPKLMLRDADKKLLLSCISKFSFPGIRRIIRSTQMTLAPRMQADGN